MGNTALHSVFTKVRDFLFSSINREFLIFLFFFALSGAFWLLMAMNETYEREIVIPVRLVDIPDNVVLSSDTTTYVRLNVRDKGYSLLTYQYGDKLHTIKINFSNYVKKEGVGLVSTAELQKLLYQQLFSSSKIVSIKPYKIEYYFNYGQKQKVPVRLNGTVEPGQSYYFSKLELTPDSVEIYANKSVLDSIKYLLTTRVNIKNVTDTLRQRLYLKRIRGVKLVPDTVLLTVYPDVLTEEKVEVPVTAVNMPEGKVLRTFPGRITVVFTCGASMFRSIHADQFKVIADYNEIVANPSDKCNIYLRIMPHGVRNARLTVSQVDYLIEEQ